MHPALRLLADRRLGLFTAAEARGAGYEHREIRHLLSSGRWVALRRGVYLTSGDLAAHQHKGSRHRLDCLAALLALGRPTAAISHSSAARLWGLPVRTGADRTVRLTDPGPWRRGKGYVVAEAPLLPAEITSLGPIRLTSAARTVVDCARECALEDAVVVADASLLAQLTTAAELRTALRRARYWPGATRAARAVSLADGRAESPLETRGRLRMLGAGLPAPQLQVEIRTGGRLVGVVDAWFDDAAVAVEFDGRVKYTDPWRRRSPERVLWDEKRREDELRGLDIRVVRIADQDLGVQWARIEARLRQLLAGPGPAVRKFSATPRSRGVRRTAG